jgi:hypothetical protein
MKVHGLKTPKWWDLLIRIGPVSVPVIVPPTLSYKPGKTLGQVIQIARQDNGPGDPYRWGPPSVAPVISDHLTILEEAEKTNLSGLIDLDGNPLNSTCVVENLATKFARGDAVCVHPGQRTYDDGFDGVTVNVPKEAVGIVLSKETTEIGKKMYRVYRVLIGMEKLLVFEEFMELAVT